METTLRQLYQVSQGSCTVISLLTQLFVLGESIRCERLWVVYYKCQQLLSWSQIMHYRMYSVKCQIAFNFCVLNFFENNFVLYVISAVSVSAFWYISMNYCWRCTWILWFNLFGKLLWFLLSSSLSSFSWSCAVNRLINVYIRSLSNYCHYIMFTFVCFP